MPSSELRIHTISHAGVKGFGFAAAGVQDCQGFVLNSSDPFPARFIGSGSIQGSGGVDLFVKTATQQEPPCDSTIQQSAAKGGGEASNASLEPEVVFVAKPDPNPQREAAVKAAALAARQQPQLRRAVLSPHGGILSAGKAAAMRRVGGRRSLRLA
jgi:hypothetical protein